MIGRKLSPSLFLSFACSFFLSFVLFFLYRLYNRNVLAATTIKDTERKDGGGARARTEREERGRPLPLPLPLPVHRLTSARVLD